jgi:hypothetical protein
MRCIHKLTGAAPQSERWGVLAVDAGKSLRFAAADSGQGGTPGATARLLSETGAQRTADSPPGAWPVRVASAIRARLTNARQERDPAWILFAGLEVVQGTVHVCTAGDIRVHLVKDGSVLHTTRDHILANEPLEWVRASYEDIDLQAQGTILSRNLGSCALPPVEVAWSAAAPFSILVCSSEHQQHRSPEAYASRLLEALLGPAGEPGESEEGLLARIDVGLQSV